jgi:predicted enzyme related to lactoylglutathione lyase
MSTRLVNVVVAGQDSRGLAGFWSALLGWPIALDEPGEIDVRAPESQGWLLDLVFGEVGGPKTGKNRIHLDLTSSSAADQVAIVQRAQDLGARKIDIGQGDVPWVVMADPEGNEFCVLEPRDVYADAGAVATFVVDAVDAESLAAFWTAATGWQVGKRDGNNVGLRAPNGRGPWLEFQAGGTPKTEKNRIHLDVAPFSDFAQADEVERVIGAGARKIDIGQGDVPWEVMADPEGNEFCVLTPR